MSRSRIPKALRAKVAAQARYRCGYCLTAESIVGTSMELDHDVGGPVHPSPGADQIPGAKAGEQQRTRPLPAPRDGKDRQNDPRRDQVHEKGEDRFPEPVTLIEDVQGEQTEEHGEQKTQDSRCPEQRRLPGDFHGVDPILM